jgi:hypothetical protein
VEKEIVDHHGLTNSSLVLRKLVNVFWGDITRRVVKQTYKLWDQLEQYHSLGQSEPEPTNNAP